MIELLLYIASQEGYLEIVKELVNNRANLNSICIEEYEYLIKNAKDLVISILKDISDIQLNIQLAKQNNHPNALKFFESLLQE